MTPLPFCSAASGASRKTSPAEAESKAEHETGDSRPKGACRGQPFPQGIAVINLQSWLADGKAYWSSNSFANNGPLSAKKTEFLLCAVQRPSMT